MKIGIREPLYEEGMDFYRDGVLHVIIDEPELRRERELKDNGVGEVTYWYEYPVSIAEYPYNYRGSISEDQITEALHDAKK